MAASQNHTSSTVPKTFDTVPDVEQSTVDRARFTTSELQSDEQARLLNAINGLRREHIDAELSIPQIVVCGDQSSGKSSVLEAIARVPFPSNVGATTCFPTEVTLRQSDSADCQIKVQLIASADRTEHDKKKIESFEQPFGVSGKDDFGRLIEAAASHLRSVEPEKRFWNDLLRAEISGPHQPHLTLVDVPGIIQSEQGAEALAGDKDRIKTMVQAYIRDERTTVLAVVNGLVDLANQEIFTLIRSVPGAIHRTLGVITRPDMLEQGSDLQRSVINLARNEKIPLDLGWHVISNLAHDKADRSMVTRDTKERDLLSSGSWTRLSNGDLGIDNLRRKLRDQLFKTILEGLPSLMADTRSQLGSCNDSLLRLGPERETIAEKRAYLSEILTKLQRLINSALKGDYEDDEFATFFDGSRERGLRDSVNELTRAFVDRMNKEGRQYHIHTDHLDATLPLPKVQELSNVKESQDLNFFPPYTSPSPGKAINIGLEGYCARLAEHMEISRGQNLPGILSTKTVKTIFRQQSVPWTTIAKGFSHQCYVATYTFLSLALSHIAGDYTAEVLQREYVRQINSQKKRQLKAKVEELLWPFTESHPMTYDTNYLSKTETRFPVKDDQSYHSFSHIAENYDSFTDLMVSAAKALDAAEAFYDIAKTRFIDEMATLGIERCLLCDLPDIIPAREATTMDDATVVRIASEPPQALRERTKLKAKAGALEAAIEIFQNYADSGPGQIPAQGVNGIVINGRNYAQRPTTNNQTAQNAGNANPPRQPIEDNSSLQASAPSSSRPVTPAQGSFTFTSTPQFGAQTKARSSPTPPGRTQVSNSGSVPRDLNLFPAGQASAQAPTPAVNNGILNQSQNPSHSLTTSAVNASLPNNAQTTSKNSVTTVSNGQQQAGQPALNLFPAAPASATNPAITTNTPAGFTTIPTSLGTNPATRNSSGSSQRTYSFFGGANSTPIHGRNTNAAVDFSQPPAPLPAGSSSPFSANLTTPRPPLPAGSSSPFSAAGLTPRPQA